MLRLRFNTNTTVEPVAYTTLTYLDQRWRGNVLHWDCRSSAEQKKLGWFPREADKKLVQTNDRNFGLNLLQLHLTWRVTTTFEEIKLNHTKGYIFLHSTLPGNENERNIILAGGVRKIGWLEEATAEDISKYTWLRLIRVRSSCTRSRGGLHINDRFLSCPRAFLKLSALLNITLNSCR